MNSSGSNGLVFCSISSSASATSSLSGFFFGNSSKRVGLLHLVGIAQRLDHQALVEGPERDDGAWPRTTIWPRPTFPVFLQRVAEDDIGLGGDLSSSSGQTKNGCSK